MKIILGQIALLEEGKCQETVIRTVDELRKKGHEAYGVFVGKSNHEDDYEKKLRATVHELSLDSYIVFLGYRTDISDILKGLDIIMIPSSFEGFPLAGLEACCAGVPVVACNVGGAKEFIEVSHAGECFDFNDPGDAAIKVLSCMANRIKYGAIGIKYAMNNTLNNYFGNALKYFAV